MTFHTGGKKLTVFVWALLLASLSLPASLSAQSYYTTVRYGRNPTNGAVYLLPNRGLPPTYGRSVAAGLSVSCSPSKLTGNIGEIILWFSSVTGGSGSYLYAWGGSDGLSGNASTLQKTYGTNGEKFATLTVTSGNQIITVSCGSLRIGPTLPQMFIPALGASCYATPERIAPGESVTWLAIVSGITASTTYGWDGTDGLAGDRPLLTKQYATPGVKAALLTVTSGNARLVAACTNAVSVGARVAQVSQTVVPASAKKPPGAPLQGLCAPSATIHATDEDVVWQAAATGGTGAYRFSWTGDDALSGNSATTSKRYEATGSKKASVTIASGDELLALSCSPVEIIKRASGLFAGGFFSWFDSPLCWILAAIIIILIGIGVVRRKRAKEQEEEEKDHVE